MLDSFRALPGRNRVLLGVAGMFCSGLGMLMSNICERSTARTTAIAAEQHMQPKAQAGGTLLPSPAAAAGAAPAAER